MEQIIEKFGNELLPLIKLGMGVEIGIGIVFAIIFIVVIFKMFK